MTYDVTSLSGFFEKPMYRIHYLEYADLIQITLVTNTYPEGRLYIRYRLERSTLVKYPDVILSAKTFMERAMLERYYQTHGNGD